MQSIQSKKGSAVEKLVMVLVGVTILVIVFNAFQISQLKYGKAQVTGKAVAQNSNSGQSASYDIDVIPKGMPRIYGMELGVSYDDISASDQQKADSTIKKLGVLDQQITLNEESMKRYIAVASQISCEYCCGTDSIIFGNGKPACGCAHSFAMRGLAKYLIKNHANEYSNDAILEELGKWKTLFFPNQMAKKALILKQKGIELNYINLASNKYRGAGESGIPGTSS